MYVEGIFKDGFLRRFAMYNDESEFQGFLGDYDAKGYLAVGDNLQSMLQSAVDSGVLGSVQSGFQDFFQMGLAAQEILNEKF